tara:strand:+ start:968 stop:1372 length:405 start_codon:yes stop_codon:yes gene_type:complete
MFNFFSKNKEKEPELPKSVCKIEFSADDEGVIWIDCYWNIEDNPQSHIMLADLMQRVFSGSMTDETLEFIKTQCAKEGKDEELQEFMESLAGFHQEYFSKVVMDNFLNLSADNKSGPVVKPTNVIGGDIRSKKM